MEIFVEKVTPPTRFEPRDKSSKRDSAGAEWAARRKDETKETKGDGNKRENGEQQRVVGSDEKKRFDVPLSFQ